MNRDTAYQIAFSLFGVSVLLNGWSFLNLQSPTLPSVFMIFGGLSLLVTSIYSLYRNLDSAPKNDVLFWLVILGAILILLGTALQLLG